MLHAENPTSKRCFTLAGVPHLDLEEIPVEHSVIGLSLNEARYIAVGDIRDTNPIGLTFVGTIVKLSDNISGKGFKEGETVVGYASGKWYEEYCTTRLAQIAHADDAKLSTL